MYGLQFYRNKSEKRKRDLKNMKVILEELIKYKNKEALINFFYSPIFSRFLKPFAEKLKARA